MQKRAAQPESEVQATSSTPLELPKEQEALFHEVLTLFEAEQLRYAVAGAFALRQHTGICRFTKDLDIFLSPQTATRALTLLERRGFRCEVCDPVWLAKVHRNEYFIDLITGMSNAVIAVDDSWIERAHPARVCGVDTRVLAPEDVIASKLFVTRRERFDGADIAHLIFASRGELQWDRIIHLAGDHWELVLWSLVLFRYVYPAYAQYVPKALWRDLIARFSHLIESDSSEEKFRGSLIDDVMFAIDVDEWGLPNLLAEQRDRRTKIGPSLRRV
jgi:putative nucleotidyltransferase-like protein